MVKFKVNVKQSRDESYFDSDTGKKVEYKSDNEIQGEFYDWEQVQCFANNVLIGFKTAIIEIKVIREDM